MSHENRACALLGCTHPVVLAGMGGPARSELAGAVTRAGGFGFLGMVREPPALIVQEVEKLWRSGVRRFGVNIIPAATPPDLLAAQIETMIALEVPVAGLFWDIDPAIVARLREAGMLVVYQVGSAREAEAAERAGAQIVIAQGREAGGHVRGVTPLRTLLPEVVAAVKVPVLAAGGLATGNDLVIARALGAEGAVFGTALLASEESFAHSYHKQRLIDAEPGDSLLTEIFHINWPPGAPVRVLSSAVTEGGGREAGVRTVIGKEDGRPIYLFSTDSPLRSMTGDFESMALYAGTGVGGVTAIRPAAEIVRRIVTEAEIKEESPVIDAATGGEIAGLLSDLRALLAGILAGAARTGPNNPPFPREGEALARWILRLAPEAAGPTPPPGPLDRDAARRAAIARIDRLQAPGLAALRDWLIREGG